MLARPVTRLADRVAVPLLVLLLSGCVSADRRAAAPAPKSAAKSSRVAAPARPTWQARKVVADAVATPQGRLHTVKRGETGIAIARAYGVEWSKVAAANGLTPPYVLEVGDRLLLPSARQAAATVATMSVEDRARAFDLDIDDIITGGEPAAPAPRTGARPSAPRPGARPPPVGAAAPLPTLTGAAPGFRWPVEGRVLSGFGAKPGGRFNDGVNLKASAGAPVRAAGEGVVAYAGDAIPGFGNLVLIKHAGGWVTAYGHNEALLVTRGKRVAQGDIIARAGATGAVSEPQVHFELRRGRSPVDPVRVIGGR
ncbi:peptidoglycan DD-metalloendopeptidase family protein [Sandarakinorhabdus sp. DWP1-3-1]|uniref:peptidoglycan DD-metalloendopeptidase family protein n=1 Tax=Sandarakinorhabdus sp. DWP1-3-1 TaxID=2804627 RepID=UPI003CECF629